MNTLIVAGLVVAAVIHLMPLPGVLGASWLERLYGTPLDDPDLLVMMRHRALLFGVLAGIMIAAVFHSEWRGLAVVVGLVSAAGFLVLALLVGGYGPKTRRVVIADVVAVAALLAAGVALVAG
ncbi:MAG: hypothetical protein QM728_14135 [Gordonia sp. (in: high G+C Gram-positive bacteria)]|uniref:hypothetical protein n=1 Tax=Gordonia sp. (in: high G+C Gram-positive bacteria) TaxID=84139 RepID=UPI0039E38910